MRETFRLARVWTRTLLCHAASLVGTVAQRKDRAAVAALGASAVAAALAAAALAAAAVVVGELGAPNPAGATPPGENGRLLIEGSRPRHWNYDIFSVDPDGSGEQRLTKSVPRKSARSSGYAAWSPDGTRIAFIQTMESYNREIFVMNADGTGKKRLTFTGAYEGYSLSIADPLAWSPDGSKHFYERGGRVWTMNADGTGQRSLPYRPRPYLWELALSPDGQKVALIASGDRSQDVWVMNSDGSGLTRLTNSPARTTSR